MTWDLPALLSILEEDVLRIFIALKKYIALAGFETANFGSSGKYANHYTTEATVTSGNVRPTRLRLAFHCQHLESV
jgi:hypothetical protein